MTSNDEVVKILTRWIDHCVARKLPQREREFWLLRDYAFGDMSPLFYEKNLEQKNKTLASLDTSKRDVKTVIEALGGKGKTEERDPF